MIAPTMAKVGEEVTFQGYADDYGTQIVAIQFSLDGGKTWVSHDTSESKPELMVHWTFTYTPKEAGHYQLRVRSVNEKGRHSPEAAVAELYVEE